MTTVVGQGTDSMNDLWINVRLLENPSCHKNRGLGYEALNTSDNSYSHYITRMACCCLRT